MGMMEVSMDGRKLRRTKNGAVKISPVELMRITKALITRLDATTAWMMNLKNQLGYKGVEIDGAELQTYIDANLAVLEPLKKKEPEQ
jgi:hypothetical protein